MLNFFSHHVSTLTVWALFSVASVAQTANPPLIYSYILNPGGNQIPVSDGGVIQFSQTPIAQSATATIIILNKGALPSTIKTVAIAGDAFTISGLPLLPVDIAPGTDLRFTVVFTPSARAQASGILRVDDSQGAKSITLQGQGSGASFTYEFVMGSTITAVPSGGAVTFPDTALASVMPATVRVSNSGNSDGTLTVVTVVGSAFQITNLVPLPLTLPAGAATTFSVLFSPTDSGPAAGKLLINSALVNLNGVGLGAKLSLAVTMSSVTNPVTNNGTILFPNTTVGNKTTALIAIRNDGNVATNINSISLTGASFTVAAQPSLPAPLAPGETAMVQIVFAPGALGNANGTLQIEGQTINLRGIGGAPPDLPSYSFTSIGSRADPLRQLSLGLSLAAGYPFDITGRVTLDFHSDSFVDDPVILFATGGRTVDFRIPANTQGAVFGSGAKSVQFQTGTVAGVISLSASFTTGSVDLTPQSATPLAVQVGAAAPDIRAVQIGTRTANSFEVLVTGFSTPRSVTSMTLQFTPAAGSNLQTTSIPINVQTAFDAWYQSTASRAVGSQFTASLTISVGGDTGAVQSVSVVATNAQGSSSSMSASLK